MSRLDRSATTLDTIRALRRAIHGETGINVDLAELETKLGYPLREADEERLYLVGLVLHAVYTAAVTGGGSGRLPHPALQLPRPLPAGTSGATDDTFSLTEGS